MSDIWALNAALVFWIVVIGGIMQYKGLLIPFLASTGLDIG